MVEPGDRARKSIHATLEGSSRAGGSGRNGGDLGRYVFRLSGDESTAKSRQGLMLCGTNSPGCECFGYCSLLAQPAKFSGIRLWEAAPLTVAQLSQCSRTGPRLSRRGMLALR